MNLLFISTHPKKKQEASDLPMQHEWIYDSFGVPRSKLTINTVYATEEPIPPLDEVHAIVIGGSSHSVYEEEEWIQGVEYLVQEAIRKEIPIFGICFGHQLIVQALGGSVGHGTQGPELGPTALEMTPEGKGDWFFDGVPQEFIGAMLHHDHVTELPDELPVKELATNGRYDYQALAIGDLIRTVQFHPEFTAEIMSGIIQKYAEDLIQKGALKDMDHADYLVKVAKEGDYSVGKKLFSNFYRKAHQQMRIKQI